LQEFVVQQRGKLLVTLWWIDGETWCFDTTFFRAENMPTF
jgi:hypothetical protein